MSIEEIVSPLFQADTDGWIDTLPEYQRRRVRQLVTASESYEDAAKKWLTAIPENTFPFGAEKEKSVFLDKVWAEVEKFLCGDQTYDADRQKLLSSKEIIQTTLVSSVSAAIAPVIGTATAFVAPVVVLIFMAMGKISLRAWCQMRKESRRQGTGGDIGTQSSTENRDD